MEYIIIVALLLSIGLVLFKERIKIKHAGNKGEKVVRKSLKKLGQGYHVFHNVKIRDGKKKTEIDCIVVGPNGVFVIEVKNQRGLITGEDKSEWFTQIKVSNSSQNQYTNEFKNPIKQLGRHVYFLSNHLKSDNLYSWIEGCLVFSNFDAKVKVTSNKVKIVTFTHKKDEVLLKAIKKMGKPNALSDKHRLKIVTSIERLLY